MRYPAHKLILGLLLASPVPALRFAAQNSPTAGLAEPNSPRTATNLAAQLSAFVAAPRFAHADWGICVESLDRHQILFETNSHRLLQPASNAKLFTAALALDRLGPQFRIRTSLFTERPPRVDGTLPGDLRIYGRGDFSFAARFHDGQPSHSLDRIVRAVREAGIRWITGDLVGDAAAFLGPPWGRGWLWDDLEHYYGAAASALTAEDNTLDLVIAPAPHRGDPCRIFVQPATDYLTFDNRIVTGGAGTSRLVKFIHHPGTNRIVAVGSLPLDGTNWIDAVAVPRPALWFVHLLRERLRREGIRIDGGLRACEWPDAALDDRSRSDAWREIGAVESPPLQELLPMMLKPSQNLYAQLLFLQVGFQATHSRTNQAPAAGGALETEQSALEELHRWVARLGIPADEVRLNDGAGLSRTARVTPAAIVQLLKAMNHHPHADAFRKGLPLAGVDGTLKDRLKQSPAEGNLRAKTGTLSGIHALSGYVTNASGEAWVFSLMVNQYPGDSAAGRADLDRLATLLAAQR